MGKVIVCGGGVGALASAYSAGTHGAEIEIFFMEGGTSLFFSGAFLRWKDKNSLPPFAQSEAVEVLTKAGYKVWGGHEELKILEASGAVLPAVFISESLRESELSFLKDKRIQIILFQESAFVKNKNLGDLEIEITVIKNRTPLQIASAIDEDPGKVREFIKNASSRDADVILVEPCLGIKRWSEALEEANNISEQKIGEITSFSSLIPGLRLLHAFRQALDRLPVKESRKKITPQDLKTFLKKDVPVVLATGVQWAFENPPLHQFLWVDSRDTAPIPWDALSKREPAFQPLSMPQPFLNLRLFTDEHFRVCDERKKPIADGKLFAAGSIAVSFSEGMLGTLFSACVAGKESAKIS